MQIILCLYICSAICGLWLQGRNHFKPQANSQQSSTHWSKLILLGSVSSISPLRFPLHSCYLIVLSFLCMSEVGVADLLSGSRHFLKHT